MIWLGYSGMPRRVLDYPAALGGWHAISSAGHLLSVAALIAGLDGFDVRKIDDIEYTVEISCYFLTKWRDDRLILHQDILKVGEMAAATEAYNGTTVEETWFPIDLEFVSKVRSFVKSWSFILKSQNLQSLGLGGSIISLAL